MATIHDPVICGKCKEKFFEGFRVGLGSYKKNLCPSCAIINLLTYIAGNVSEGEKVSVQKIMIEPLLPKAEAKPKKDPKDYTVKDKLKEISSLIKYIFSQKKYFYGNYKYSEALKDTPDPIKRINQAINYLEQAERELKEAELA